MSITSSQFTLVEDTDDPLLKHLYWELEEYMIDGGDKFTKHAFKDQVPSKDIKKFVDSYEGYDGRWSLVPGYDEPFFRFKNAYVAIINDILRYFGRDGTRQAVDTQFHPMGYDDRVQTRMATSPSISIMGCGSNIGPEHSIYDEPLYTQVLAPIEIDADGLPEKLLLYHIAVYVRFCFFCQPSRLFINSLLLTGDTARLFYFDRSDVVYSNRIDIHHDPETFVRFILGMSSLNASDLGFDPRIYWRLKQQYFKPDLESDVEYRISRLNSKSLMRGRGTACYRVDHEGEKFFLKLYWHPVEKVPEWEFLLKAQEADIKGVAKVELYGEYVCISDLRCVPLVSTVGCDINDRVYTFIMQPMYGGTLTLKEFWKSYPEEQFLLAYRDTLAASMELLQIGIIHGDVNPFNILYNPGGLPGSRGILIDFDMALYIDEGQARDTVEPIIRVEAFRSIKVQEGHRYCHFDDIESFLYTYFRVCVCKPAEDDYVEFFTQDVIVDWKNSDHAMLKSFKKRLFGADNGHALRCLYGRDLSRPVLDLFIDLQRFFERQISRSLRKIDEERLGYNREEQSRPCLRVSDRLRAKMAERLDKLYERMPETYIKSLDAEGCNKWFTLLAKRHYYELLYYVDHAVATLRRTSSDAQTEITSQASEPSAPCGDRNYPKLSESKNAALQAASGNGLNVITSITNTPESNVKRTRSASDSISCNGREAKKAKEAVYYRIM